ncbi:MAG: Smr/MutS family protein [Gammaproteobacteria bacterium]
MKKPTITPEQRALFRSAMKDVAPLNKSQRRSEHTLKKPTAVILQRPSNDNTHLHLKDHLDEIQHAVSAEGPLFFAQPGILPKTLRQLKRGELPIEANLDLHGMNIEQARAALSQFIHQTNLNHHRIICIIHGKGNRSQAQHPILKNLVNIWLRQFRQVLTFCSAQAKDGGTGAVYVLLKK